MPKNVGFTDPEVILPYFDIILPNKEKFSP